MGYKTREQLQAELEKVWRDNDRAWGMVDRLQAELEGDDDDEEEGDEADDDEEEEDDEEE